MPSISDFNYDLPPERIAIYPKEQRDRSKLLFYNKGRITHQVFTTLPDLLPNDALLVFNNTKVVPARMLFKRQTGAVIEILLLEPSDKIIAAAMTQTGKARWKAMIGNKKKWKEGETVALEVENTTITKKLKIEARWHDREANEIELSWQPAALALSEVMETAGAVPLPPYLNREANTNDKQRYQTVYAQHDGSVAAPTAGLHFTEAVLTEIAKKGIEQTDLTLHVGAGTFLPVKEDDISKHLMHTEQISCLADTIRQLAKHSCPIIPVGTTAMRTLESLYWFGAGLLYDNNKKFNIEQEEPYQFEEKHNQLPPDRKQALSAILDYVDRQKISRLTGRTGIFIRPGYKPKMCNGLITNFHQPKSTLLLLVSALIGDNWQKVYQEALSNDYRFLSYGDSSLLIP